eukprot:CAMPEP_0194317800 /NCGR_PEP_ID=MMETSP0171-20130528/14523_1 /TAXON_ID=218684 /ORGANISM="Corethron pennatum, Strain L29A3" /LENGTH=714 /DNA_ID=CAMNT_0039074521 /DNA_START=78 /DNA_END=2225 /DNA_ORIENTATION=+
MVKLVVKNASYLAGTVGVLDVKFRWKVTFSPSSSSSSSIFKKQGKWTSPDTCHKESHSTLTVCDVVWKQDGAVVDLGEEDDNPDATVKFVLKKLSSGLIKETVGETSFTLRDLVRMCQKKEDNDAGIVELMLFDPDTGGLVVAGADRSCPTIVRVSIVDEKATATQAPNRYDKRIMVVTRGTRGDVQPFLALSRGLAELLNWEIIFVTELGFQESIRKQQNTSRGRIRFRPSGGNTEKRVKSALGQFAVSFKLSAGQTNTMQKLMLSRSEMEFFGSEPAVFYWAKKLKPELLLYGFTMASITTVVSEALKIPLIGFMLQPTCIPSQQYPPTLPLKEKNYRLLTPEKNQQSHEKMASFKYLIENTPTPNFIDTMASMRRRRGLKPYATGTSVYQELKDKNYPLVVPIHEALFGGKPKDWSENAVFTDCIFLRGDTVPPLADDAKTFLENAKAMDQGRVVVLAFSSMPVTRDQIVDIALRLISSCQRTICVFALSASGTGDEGKLNSRALNAIKEGRLFLASRAPFGRLFSEADAIVLHGGLGTTCEALQAKKPAIVTGVLLLDQRFWGMRCEEMGVGPFGCHIDDFPKHCVSYVNKALEDDSSWKKNAVEMGALLSENEDGGIQCNVQCIADMAQQAKPYWYCAENAFEVFDLDKNGHLSMEEIKKLVQTLNIQMSDTQIENMFIKADMDGSGTIDEHEFNTYMYKIFLQILEEE